MLTVYVRASDERLEIGRGELRARFELKGEFWVPTWMWQGERRMLRFKNHEWLSLGHIRPGATDWEVTEDSAERALVRFWGEETYFGVPVEWSVWVGADVRWPGFTITTEILPAQTIELVECFTRFETPPDYDDREEVLCMVSQTPVTAWKAGRSLTARSHGYPTLRGRDQEICGGAFTRTPVACFKVGPDESGEDCYITLFGHWDLCCFRNICILPGPKTEGRRSYEFLVGALDWRCSAFTEPNVFFKGGEVYRQRVSVAFASEMPGGTLDRWFFGAFERNLKGSLPPDGVIESARRARAKGVDLAKANSWWLDVFSGDGVPGLYSPSRGIVSYTEGTSPAAGRFSMRALAPWIAALGYQAYVTRREDLREVCERLVGPVAEAIDRPLPKEWAISPVFSEILPLLHFLTCYPNDLLHGAIRRALGRLLETFPPEVGERPDLDFGSEVLVAEAYLLAGQLAGDKQLLDIGLASLERINVSAKERFWRFGCTSGWEDAAAGGQARPTGYGHAILANLIAHQRTHDPHYLEMTGMFARFLAALCFSTFNDSDDPDFDTRGFANGAIAGEDRLVECSPIETSEGLRCIAYRLAFQPELPKGFYDLLWLLSRTFTGVFPAARERRRGFTVDGRLETRPNEELPTEIAYRRFPYLAYENPVRQIRLSPRAGLEALQNYLTFGGALASCDNDLLLVLLPRAAGFDLAERIGRLVHIYNPTETQQEGHLAIHHLPARRQFEVIVQDKRIAAGLAGDALNDIKIEVPPREVLVVEVVPSRHPSTYF